MCGICCILGNIKTTKCDLTPIQKRGPDFFAHHQFSHHHQPQEYVAAVLSLQRTNDNQIAKMPIFSDENDEDGNCSTFIWNGEVFFGGGNNNNSAATTSSDTLFVANTLFRLEEEYQHSFQQFADATCSFFRSIGGPFAFVYTTSKFGAADTTIFGRDVWGRRSLLVGKSVKEDCIVISSTIIPCSLDDDEENTSNFSAKCRSAFYESLPKEQLFSGNFKVLSNNTVSETAMNLLSPVFTSWEEVKPDGIYAISGSTAVHLVSKYEECDLSTVLSSSVAGSCPRTTITTTTASATKFPVRLHPLSDAARFDNHSVYLPLGRSRGTCIHSGQDQQVRSPPLCIHDDFLKSVMEFVFSKLLAAASSSSAKEFSVSNLDEVVSRITSWFVRRTGYGPEVFCEELMRVMRQRYVPAVFSQVKKFLDSKQQSRTEVAAFTCSFIYMTVLAIAVHRRTASWNTNQSNSILILFSGGIDCVVLTRLVDIVTTGEPIALDLINVAFGKSSEKECMSVTDRISCFESVREILDQHDYDDRRPIRLILADVSGEDILHLSPDIAACILPKNTVMDTCIGSALYFGARGQGRLSEYAVRRRGGSKTILDIEEEIEKKDLFPVDHQENEEQQDAASSPSSNNQQQRFAPLLKCLIRHFVDRGEEEMSICLLGKEYTSDELMKTNSIHEYKSLRHQVEAAQIAGLVRMRGISYSSNNNKDPADQEVANAASSSSTAVCAEESQQPLPQIRPRNEPASSEKKEDSKQQQTKKKCSQGGRDYLISITHPESKQLAVDLRMERLKLGALIKEETPKDDFTATARIIIAGMGADESLGGYHRYCHSKSKKKDLEPDTTKRQNDDQQQQQQQQQQDVDLEQQQQHLRLQTEMQKDFDRLWERNLGRDDRVMSSFGREARFPFLDECLLFALSGIVSWAEKTSKERNKTGESNDDDEDEEEANAGAHSLFRNKNILRLGADKILGLTKVSSKPKKAIQFGTKIANRKNKGEQVCL